MINRGLIEAPNKHTIRYWEKGQFVSKNNRGPAVLFEVDRQTGLPKTLHEGAYFKISRTISDYYHMHYMLPRRGWFDKKIDSYLIDKDLALTDEEIIWSALGLLVKVQETMAKQAARTDSKVVLGKYPPRSLGQR